MVWVKCRADCPLQLEHGTGGLVAPGLDSVNCRYVVGLVDCFWWYNGEKPGPGPC